MKNIKCQNCGMHVLFSKEMHCPECNVKNYGYDPISNMPQQYQVIIDNGFASPPIDLPKSNPIPRGSKNPPPIKSDEIENMPTIPTGGRRAKESNTPSLSQIDGAFGWLIVHTEGKEQVDFKLKEGVNYIGRPVTDIKPDIEVPDDTYVSRGHAVLEVIPNPGTSNIYKLTDDVKNLHQGESTNGTHVNGDRKRLKNGESIYLKDGDTIQIGETKLVLKTPNQVVSVDEARTQVIEMDYEKTIFKGK